MGITSARIAVLVALAALLFVPSPGLASPPPDAVSTSMEGEGPAPVRETFDRVQPARRLDRDLSFLGGGALALDFATANQDPEGDIPRDIEFLPDGTACVIPNRDTDTVTFFDVATRTITDTVPTEDFPVDIAVAPNGSVAVVPNVFSDSVTLIDLSSRTVLANVPITGTQPYRVAVTSDSAFAVVGIINDGVSSAVSVIDLNTQTEVRNFATVSQGAFGFFFTPEPGISGNIFTQFALSSDDTTLVVPDRGGSQVVLYDITTGAQIAALPTAALPTSVDISADGMLAVVGHEGANNTITTIDVSGASLIASLGTSNSLVNQVIRVTPDKAFAMAAISNNLIFVDLATGATTATISTGTVGDIEISFDDQYAFVSNFNSRIIDIATQTLVRTIAVAPSVEAATSPTELRAVALNSRFREDVHLYNINGGAGFFEGKALSGEIEEGDAIRTVAISPDGTTAIGVGNTSNNAAIYDLPSGTVRGYASTGERSLGAAISADGQTAVVANFTSNTVSVIDLTTDTTVATLNVSQGPAEVAISPDGQFAYVTTIAGTDRVHFIQLAGAGSSVLGSVISGQMGSIGYTYGVFSGISLSPDGSILAACISFDDQLLLIDTATRTELGRVAVGDFPIRVAFSPDGAKAYVAHSFSDDLRVVDVATRTVDATVPGIEFPLQVDVDADGSYVYVGSFDFSNPRIAVVDTSSNTIVSTVSLGATPRSSALAIPDGIYYTTLTDGNLVAIDAAGPASAVLETVPLSAGPSDLAFAHAAHTVVIAQPIPDGIDVVRMLDEFDCRRGNLDATSGFTADVVTVSGSVGAPIDRTVTLGPGDAFSIDVAAPPSRPGGPSKFALYAWLGSPDTDSVRVLPFDLGSSCMVMPPSSVPERPQDDPRRIWNNIGNTNVLGNPNLPSSPAPTLLINKPNGLGRTIEAFLQGLMLDSAAPQGQAGVTNGVRILIQ